MVEKLQIITLYGSDIMVKLIGVIASILIFISMCVKSTTITGNIAMRIINILGSIIFIYYGYLLSAYSTILLNAVCTIINLYYIISMKKADKNS